MSEGDEMTMTPIKFSDGEFNNFVVGAAAKIDTSVIPSTPGIYAVVRRRNTDLVYVGKAKGKFKNTPRSLRDRFSKEHFKERARGSRLRRLVAIELGIPLVKDHSGRLAVDMRHEKRISNYIEEELCFSFIIAPWERVDYLEIAAIGELKPRWNIQHSSV
jgi:hypothetical protein